MAVHKLLTTYIKIDKQKKDSKNKLKLAAKLTK